jgi:hypothetical protein
MLPRSTCLQGTNHPNTCPELNRSNSARLLFACLITRPWNTWQKEGSFRTLQLYILFRWLGTWEGKQATFSQLLDSPSQDILEIVDFAVGERDDGSGQPRTWTAVSRGQIVSFVHCSCSASDPTPKININHHLKPKNLSNSSKRSNHVEILQFYSNENFWIIFQQSNITNYKHSFEMLLLALEPTTLERTTMK